MSKQTLDWSESLATMPARITTLTNFLHDRKFDKAASLISNLADDLNEVLNWIIEERKQELPKFGPGFVTVTEEEVNKAYQENIDKLNEELLRQRVACESRIDPVYERTHFRDWVAFVGGTITEVNNFGVFSISVPEEYLEEAKRQGELVRSIGVKYEYSALEAKPKGVLCKSCSMHKTCQLPAIGGAIRCDRYLPAAPIVPKPADFVPTMKLRWLNNYNFPPVLQQWHYDRSKPDAAGQYPEGKWIDVPVETGD